VQTASLRFANSSHDLRSPQRNENGLFSREYRVVKFLQFVVGYVLISYKKMANYGRFVVIVHHFTLPTRNGWSLPEIGSLIRVII
jgi:hypothetical protein